MRVNTTIDDVSPLITYVPAANFNAGTKTDPKWTEYYQQTYTMCSKLGDNATFTFTGTGVWLYGALRSNHGLYNVTLDGTTVTRDGFASGEGLYQQVLFGASDLEQTTHTVTLTNNRNSTAFANLDLDFIIFEEELGGPTDTLNTTTVDDGEAAFTYGPAATAWSTVGENMNLPLFHAGTGHTTVTSTGFVAYTFNGSAATVYGVLGPKQGPYTVQLDAGPVVNYTATATVEFTQQVLYHVTGLDAGTHVVKISNQPTTAGQALSIDYAVALAIQVPITTTSTTMSSTSSTASSTSTESTDTSVPTVTPGPSSSSPSTGVIVAAVLGSLALLAMLSFAVMMFRRRRNSRKDFDEKPDMAAMWPEPYSVGHEGYGGGSGRYIPPSQNMTDGYNPLHNEGSPLYPPSRGPYDQNSPGPGYFNGQHVDGASLFSGIAPGVPRNSGHSNSTHQPAQRRGSASTRLPYDQSDVASTAPYGRESAYTGISDGASRMPAHGHGTLTDVTEPPLPPLPPNANQPQYQRNLGLHNPPPLHTGLIPPRKGQREQVTLPPSAAPEQRDAFRGLSEEELRQRRLAVEGREQDFGPLALDDEPLGVNAPLPPDYTQATEALKR